MNKTGGTHWEGGGGVNNWQRTGKRRTENSQSAQFAVISMARGSDS